MAETLYIRLASQADSPIHWMINSSTEQDIIASGELPNAAALEQLSDKALQRKVVVFVPGSDVTLKKLNVPAKSARAVKLAVPYMLEDDLAQDVDSLFFAYAKLNDNTSDYNCFVAAVDKHQMDTWLEWLDKANLKTRIMLPDMLAMPIDNEAWTAVQLGEQVLLRKSSWDAYTVDCNLWPIVSSALMQPEGENQQSEIKHYSVLPQTDAAIQLTALPEELPMALLAAHWQETPFNLLQEQYKVKDKTSPALKSWLVAASVCCAAVLLNVMYKGVTVWQLSSQQAQLEQTIVERYKQAFPETKRVRITTLRSQLKRKMSDIGGSQDSADFLTMLTQLQPAFAEVPELKPESIKFDGKRNELRLQATAKGYQEFEKFKRALEQQQFTVSQGAQNNQGDVISGSFSIIDNKKGGRS